MGIASYLSREYHIKDHWYPKDSKRQSKVDEYLEWQHLNIRYHCSSYFLSMVRRYTQFLELKKLVPVKVVFLVGDSTVNWKTTRSQKIGCSREQYEGLFR